MQSSNELQNWVAQRSPWQYGLLIGLSIGLIGGVVGLLLAVAGPVIAVGAVLGTLIGLYVLTDVRVALYASIATMLLLPFGTFPVKIAITPTLLDMALAAFVLVYLFQWMTGQRQRIQLTPVHALITLYLMWLIFSFLYGTRHAPATATNLRQFAETLLSIGLTFILVDLLRDRAALRRLVLVVLIAIGVQAALAVGLYVLPDTLSESILIRLSRIGYPGGGVIRYIEDNPALSERAIGTWVDPNALGGVLAISAAMLTPQVLARQPVLRFRWLTALVLGLVGLALLLTFSRASFLALGAGLLLIATLRYRRFLPFLVLAGVVFVLLPQTQGYIERLLQAFQGADLATQMRLGEWRDSLTLISRYPVFGVGFTGTPDIDIYTDVANMYLIMANQIGLTGVALYGITMLGILIYGHRAWQIAKNDPELEAIHLGYHIALVVALINAVADLYYFRLDFQSSITWFWLLVALALSSSRLSLATLPGTTESTLAKPDYLR